MYRTSKSIDNSSNFVAGWQNSNSRIDDHTSNVDILFKNIGENDEDFFPIPNQYSKVVLPNGRIYEGELSSDQMMNGNGVLYSKEGNIIYSGSWRNSKFNGYGTLYNENFDPKLTVNY